MIDTDSRADLVIGIVFVIAMIVLFLVFVVGLAFAILFY